MQLRHFDRGMRLQIFIRNDNGDIEEYEAQYYDLHDLVGETSFLAQSSKLSREYDTIDQNVTLEISAFRGATVYTFAGRIIGKKSPEMVIIELISDIKTLNRRIYQRDELRIDVRIHKMEEDKMNEPRYEQPMTEPVMTEMSFDISAGGMCVITNKVLRPENHKHFLIDFYLAEKERFLLPSLLVRRSNYARSAVGKFDYGFKFIFDNMPDEKARLTKAILGRKLSSFK